MPVSRSSRGKRPNCWFFLAFALASFLLAGCERQEDPKVPVELIGVWKTNDPRYRDLFLEITERAVIFSTTEGGLETCWISKIESSNQGKTSAHVIHGARSGQHLKFQLYYEASAGGRLRFKNQLQMAWSKVTHDGS
jgi:hypothetical protein